MSVTLSDAVSDLVAAAEKLRADDAVVTSAERMLNELEALFDVVRAVESAIVPRLREVFNADATTVVCGRTTKAWLGEEMFLPGTDVSRLLRLVHHLRCYPATEAAFNAAEISIAHAIAIIGALEKLPQVYRPGLEPQLVEHARWCRPEEISSLIDALLDGLGHETASTIRRERRHAERGVDVHKTLHGTRSLHGNLEPEVGEALEQALALAGADGPASPDDDRTPRQRQHDALGAIASAYLAGNGTPSFTGTPRTAIVTIDLETLEDQLRQKWLTLPDGATISAATARRLACDAEIIPVVLGSRGEVLDIGQADREFTVPIRRAAWVRDGGRCAFPSCRGKPVELHHIVFRRHGGATALDNAAWLCLYHHWLIHERGWTLQRDPVDKSYVWTGPGAYGRQLVRRLGTA